jgi:hypothetical protein
MLPLPAGDRQDNGDGTRWFHGLMPQARGHPAAVKIRQIVAFGRFSRLFALTRGFHRL